MVDNFALLRDKVCNLLLRDVRVWVTFWHLDRFEIMGHVNIDDLLNDRLSNSFYYGLININNLLDDRIEDLLNSRLEDLLNNRFLRLYLANHRINFIERLLYLCN